MRTRSAVVGISHLLLVDDDVLLVPEQVRHAFPPSGYRVEVVGTASAAIEAVRRDAPDAILLDLRLPDRSGLDVYQQIRATNPRIPVVFITTANSSETAIEAIKQGAYDYLHKPLDLEQLRKVIGAALETSRMRAPVALAVNPTDPMTDGAMLGASKAMLEIYKAIGRVAAQDVPVLITGESGTGKELVARAIWQHSARSSEPFLAINCAAIPEALLETEFFGHEKGAFTGADRRRIGKFEQCNGGTVLLDEIGDMPLLLQAKLLRFLQEQAFERVGGNETIRTNVRVIASTHRDLRQRSEEDKFRLDLYYRLSVFTIHLPPLRDRGEDISPLSQFYLNRFSRDMGRQVRNIADEALATLQAYPWPGNIRELQSVLRQALLQANGEVLTSTCLPDFLIGRGHGSSETQPSGRGTPCSELELARFIRERLVPGAHNIADETHREVDRLLLRLTLEYTHGNQRDAAKVLGISRQTLRVRLRSLGIHVAQSIESDVPAR